MLLSKKMTPPYRPSIYVPFLFYYFYLFIYFIYLFIYLFIFHDNLSKIDLYNEIKKNNKKMNKQMI